MPSAISCISVVELCFNFTVQSGRGFCWMWCTKAEPCMQLDSMQQMCLSQMCHKQWSAECGMTHTSCTCRRCCPELLCIILSCCSRIFRKATALILAYSRHQWASSANCLSYNKLTNTALKLCPFASDSLCQGLLDSGHEVLAKQRYTVLTACCLFSLPAAVKPASTDSLRWRASRPVCLR